MSLNERKLAVLSLISKAYLKTGEPVGSKALSLELGGSVSSATIRNDMAELEALGLLYQPHTSAGRIPTVTGLRLYIERLMQRKKLSKDKREFIDSLFSNVHSVEGAVSAAASALADYTKCASFSTVPTGKEIFIKKIDLIKTDGQTMIFVILTSTNIVKSSFVRLGAEATDVNFEVFKNFITEKLTSTSLSDVTLPFVQTLAAEFMEYALIYSPFFSSLLSVCDELNSSGLKINGQDNLFNDIHINAARALEVLNSDSLFNIISHSSSGPMIVMADNLDMLSNTALIYSNYHLSDNLIGSVGILGPSRLDYGTLIPLIDYFSKSLENMLKNAELYK